MRAVRSCSGCSKCVVVYTAGFVRDELWKCLDRGEHVDASDGCTFGDDSGQLIGCVRYDVDLSQTQVPQEYPY